MKPRVFVTRMIPGEGLEILQKVADVKVWEEELPPPHQVILREVKEAEGILSLLSDRIDKNIIEAGKKLKVIGNYAVGFDNIDIEAATARDIFVTNTPGALTEATADLAFALLTACARRIVEASKYAAAGKWKTWGPRLLLGQEIYGSTLGLVGLGRIGSAVARRAKGFNMRVIYHSRKPNETLEKELGVTYVSLDDLLKQSDFVSLHVPLNEDTKDLINAKRLGLMKKNAVLINTARGPVVNEKDLYEALKEGVIWGAGLDVTSPEPPLWDNPLFQLDNVVIVPHIGSASVITRTKMAIMAAENIAAVLKGEKPVNLVNNEVLLKR